jgi:endo-1,3(4)-beta-glucanase
VGSINLWSDKAIDGDMNTRWGSNWSEPQWLSITLPAPQVVNRIVPKWEAAYAKEYCVTVIE